MAAKTRGLYFSVACDSGSICGRTTGGSTDDTGRRRRIAERGMKAVRGNGGGGGGKTSFCATFGRAEAWTLSEKFGVATEGERDGEPIAATIRVYRFLWLYHHYA